MELAAEKAWEVGFFHALLDWSTPLVSLLLWAALLFGVVVQVTVLTLARRRSVRYIVLIFAAVFLLALECACQVITGWELFTLLLFYCVLLLFLLGAGICTLAWKLRTRQSGDQ